MASHQHSKLTLLERLLLVEQLQIIKQNKYNQIKKELQLDQNTSNEKKTQSSLEDKRMHLVPGSNARDFTQE